MANGLPGGARPGHVTKITIFVAGYRRECMRAIGEGRAVLLGSTSRPTRPDYLIKVDAIAVIDSARRISWRLPSGNAAAAGAQNARRWPPEPGGHQPPASSSLRRSVRKARSA